MKKFLSFILLLTVYTSAFGQFLNFSGKVYSDETTLYYFTENNAGKLSKKQKVTVNGKDYTLKLSIADLKKNKIEKLCFSSDKSSGSYCSDMSSFKVGNILRDSIFRKAKNINLKSDIELRMFDMAAYKLKEKEEGLLGFYKLKVDDNICNIELQDYHTWSGEFLPITKDYFASANGFWSYDEANNKLIIRCKKYINYNFGTFVYFEQKYSFNTSKGSDNKVIFKSTEPISLQKID